MHLACCDCGLVHLIKVRLRNGRLRVSIDRAPKQTGGIRAAMKRGEEVTAADQNPKHAAGRAKQPHRHIPPLAIAAEGRVFAGGAEKYGPFNWGGAGVVASVYYEAILRHLFEWYTAGQVDAESRQSHLAHIRACCGILMDF